MSLSRIYRKIFGYRLSETEFDAYGRSLVKRADLEVENKKLKDSISKLEQLVKKLESDVIHVDMGLGDPSPVDKEQRALYVAQVAGLHKEILEPKLKKMISDLYLLLEESTNDREYDQAVKGAIYFAKEMIRWGNLMISEQLAIQTNQKPGSPEDGEIINNN